MKSNRLSYLAAAIVSAAIACSCAQSLPPEEFLTPAFEEVSFVEEAPGVIGFICTVSSMSQLTEYGLDYTSSFNTENPEWIRVKGVKTGNKKFQVTIDSFDPGTTYCYRLFIGNGKDILQSAQNYYTTPE